MSVSSPGSAFTDVPLRVQTVTPSELCNDPRAFRCLCEEYRVTNLEIPLSSPCFSFVVQEPKDIEANITVVDGVHSMAGVQLDSPAMARYVPQLCQMLIPGPNDPYLISRHAPFIIQTYYQFLKSVLSRNEARFRRQIDSLIELVFDFEPDPSNPLVMRVEVPTKLPPLSPEARGWFTALDIDVAQDLRPVIDTAVLRPVKFTGIIEFQNALIHPDMEIPKAYRDAGAEVLAELLVEYKIHNRAQLQNRVIMDMTASLYQRQSLGLCHKPVYGIAMHGDTLRCSVVYFYGCWETPSNKGGDNPLTNTNNAGNVSDAGDMTAGVTYDAGDVRNINAGDAKNAVEVGDAIDVGTVGHKNDIDVTSDVVLQPNIYYSEQPIDLNDLEAWVCFYVSLMKLKARMLVPGTNPVSTSLGKRVRSDDLKQSNKKQKGASHFNQGGTIVFGPTPQRPTSTPTWIDDF